MQIPKLLATRKPLTKNAVHRSRFPGRVESLETRDMMSATPLHVTSVHLGSSSWSSAFTSQLETAGLGDSELGFLIPTGSSAQLAPVPWTGIDQISIGFSEDASVQQNDLALSSVTAKNIAFDQFFYDPQKFVATWTLSQALTSNAYRLDLDGDGAGKVIGQFTASVLDGEWTDGVSTFGSGSGDGTAGGDFEFTIRVLTGDTDCNASVDSYGDYYVTMMHSGETTASSAYSNYRDLDGNGVINNSDLNVISASYGQTASSGAPLGAYNDAPSAKGIPTKKLIDSAVNYEVSLWAAFSDAETTDSALQYTFTVSNSSLFDAVTYDAATGKLTLNAATGASGRAQINVTATDSYGMSTSQSFLADANYVDQAPVLTFYASNFDVENWTWKLGGTVSDPDDLAAGTYVYLHGVINSRAVVRKDGTWEFVVIIDPADWDWEYADYADPHGVLASQCSQYLGL